MDTHAHSVILFLKHCLLWERQIPTDTMESWKKAEPILGTKSSFKMCEQIAVY